MCCVHILLGMSVLQSLSSSPMSPSISQPPLIVLLFLLPLKYRYSLMLCAQSTSDLLRESHLLHSFS